MTINAIRFPVFQPAMRIISNITNSNPAIVTTTFDHQYKDELICRLDIPPGYGMEEANQLFGQITVIGATTFTIAIDTTFFQPFTTPSTFPQNAQYPQVVPFGENNDTLINATRNVLPY